MVLEYLVNPINAETHPRILIFHGFLYASLGIILGYWIFNEHSSLIMVFLTTMAAIPLIYNIIKVEEKKDLLDIQEANLLKEHSRALQVFMYYFIGTTLGFALWYSVLPTSITKDLFRVQIDTVLNIRSGVTAGAYESLGVFTSILANNLKVLIFCIIFSFLYGIGSVFILTWNASVIGYAIGDTIKRGIYQLGVDFNIFVSHQYAGVVTCGLFRYAPHGIPEILAYFVAGLAGGIISTAAIRHDFGTKKYINIIMDSAVLLLLSLFLLVISAWLEVYITPSLISFICPGIL